MQGIVEGAGILKKSLKFYVELNHGHIQNLQQNSGKGHHRHN